MKDRDSRHSGFKLIVKKKPMLMSEPVKEFPFFTDVLNMPDILFNKYCLFFTCFCQKIYIFFSYPRFHWLCSIFGCEMFDYATNRPIFPGRNVHFVFCTTHPTCNTPNKHIKPSESALGQVPNTLNLRKRGLRPSTCIWKVKWDLQVMIYMFHCFNPDRPSHTSSTKRSSNAYFLVMGAELLIYCFREGPSTFYFIFVFHILIRYIFSIKSLIFFFGTKESDISVKLVEYLCKLYFFVIYMYKDTCTSTYCIKQRKLFTNLKFPICLYLRPYYTLIHRT